MTEDFDEHAAGNWGNNYGDQNEARRALSTILTSVLDILDDEDDFSLGEIDQGQGAATSGQQKATRGQ